MTKLIIQIPCYNEAETLPITLRELPRQLPGIDTIEWLIIDDGSTDNTVEVARRHGVDHIVRLRGHRGLAHGFCTGLKACLDHGADIIVNTDADNQYHAGDIGKLIEPVLLGDAEMVVGERPIFQIHHFSLTKKLLQKAGSLVVRLASRTNVPDAPSGFRAISRDAARQLRVFNDYTYTLETLIQAGQKGMTVQSVPIRVNGDLRPSRLVRSIPSYIFRSFTTIARIFITYRPFRFFASIGLISILLGIAACSRFLLDYLIYGAAGHVQSLILGALFIGSGFFLVVTGITTDLIAVNRKLLERIDLRVQDLDQSHKRVVSLLNPPTLNPQPAMNPGQWQQAAEEPNPDGFSNSTETWLRNPENESVSNSQHVSAAPE